MHPCRLVRPGPSRRRQGPRPAVPAGAHQRLCESTGGRRHAGRYAQGYAQGLQQYCVVENAFSLGANGGQYKGVCPAAIDPQFRRRFDAGRAIYDTRQEVKRLQERINDKERELTQTHKDEERKLRDQKRSTNAAASSAILSSRHRLRSEIEQLDRQLYRARDQQYDAERRGRQHQ